LFRFRFFDYAMAERHRPAPLILHSMLLLASPPFHILRRDMSFLHAARAASD
jgi:hypothetical protein